MKTIRRDEILMAAIQRMKKYAWTGLFHGTDSIYDKMYLAECRWKVNELECTVLFTRDTGHHSCGWWKNPDYELSYHLSVCFFGGKDQKAIEKLLDGLYGEHKKWVWVEPPYSDAGKTKEVWHYRLFADENWQPIKPRGEVYTKEFTEAGWKSYSAVQAELEELREERKLQQKREEHANG